MKRSTILTIIIGGMILSNPLWVGGQWQALSDTDFLIWLSYPMSMSGFTPFACLFPIVPCCLRFSEEFNSGTSKYCLIRGTRARFVRYHIKQTVITGGVVMAAIFGMVMLACVIGGTAPALGQFNDGFYEGTIWEAHYYSWGGYKVLLLKLLLAILFGMVWSLVSLIVSCLWTNRYASVVLPFVIYQILWHGLQGLSWNPVFLLRGDYRLYTSVVEPFTIQGGVLLVLVLTAGYFLRRKTYDV